MNTKHLFLTVIGAVALTLSASASEADLNSGKEIQAPKPTVSILSEAPEVLVQKLHDAEQERIRREKTQLAQLKFDDLLMTDAFHSKERGITRLSPSTPVHQASE